MDWHNYIERRSDVMLGKPVFKGTRLTVEFILERLGQGASEADLLHAYPTLRPQFIHAAQAYAADMLKSESGADLGVLVTMHSD